MKNIRILFYLLMAVTLSATISFAATLSLQDKGDGVIDVIADDTTNVLGAAFTVEYDNSVLDDPSVTSAYFGTFLSQGYKANENGLDAAGKVEGFASPLVDNPLSSGAVRLAAARHTAEAGTNVAIFTLTFQLKAGATAQPTTVKIVPTELDNPTAGYDPTDTISDKLNPLIGVSGDDFPAQLTVAALEETPPMLENYDPFGNPNPFTLDIDGNGQYDASTDGSLIYRYLSNFHVLYSTAWTTGVIGQGATRTPDEIKAYLATGNLDIDGNSQADASTDGSLIYRYLSNFHVLYSTAWTTGVIGQGATRTPDEIKAYLSDLTP